MDCFSVPIGRPGRPLRFSDRAIALCLTLKGLFHLPLRQVTGMVANLLRLAGLDWSVPGYTTLCRRQKTLSVSLGGRPGSQGLHLLADSTGIKMMGEGEWKTRKHGVLALGHAPGMSAACDIAANGARFISGSPRKLWISARSRSQPTRSAMPRRCLTCCRKSPMMRRSSALAVTAHTTQAPLAQDFQLRRIRRGGAGRYGF